MVIRRSRPECPASSSRSKAPESETSRRMVATVTPRGWAVSVIAAMLRESARNPIPIVCGRHLLRLDQPEIAVFAPIQNADSVRFSIPEHDEGLSFAIDSQRRVFQ